MDRLTGLKARLNASFAAGPVGLHHDVATQAPLELRGPFAGEIPLFFLRNTTCGLLDGDNYEINLTAREGSALQVASPSAMKALAMPSSGACTSVRLRALPESRLVWGPHCIILQQGADLSQEARYVLHPGGVIIATEIIAFGRLASGERLRFKHFESTLTVVSPDARPLFEERYSLEPSPWLETGLGGQGVLVSVYGLGFCIRDAAIDLEERAKTWGPLTGFSVLPNEAGIVVRMLTDTISEGIAFANAAIAALHCVQQDKRVTR